jgi:hypothetical protein
MIKKAISSLLLGYGQFLTQTNQIKFVWIIGLSIFVSVIHSYIEGLNTTIWLVLFWAIVLIILIVHFYCIWIGVQWRKKNKMVNW